MKETIDDLISMSLLPELWRELSIVKYHMRRLGKLKIRNHFVSRARTNMVVLVTALFEFLLAMGVTALIVGLCMDKKMGKKTATKRKVETSKKSMTVSKTVALNASRSKEATPTSVESERQLKGSTAINSKEAYPFRLEEMAEKEEIACVGNEDETLRSIESIQTDENSSTQEDQPTSLAVPFNYC